MWRNLFGCLCIITLSSSYGLPGCVQPPLECPNENITFWLYTRQNENNPHQINALDANSIETAPWVADAPIKILIHSYAGNKDSSPNTEIRPVYMQCCNYNIMSVDYSPIARKMCYSHAVANIELVGKCTAQLIDSLVNHGFALSRFHVIGYGLGGHTAGFTGNYLTSGKLDRITGLDPAVAHFGDANETRILDRSDAKYVDILYTNSWKKGHLGPTGHVNFFVNSWLYQSGCPKRIHQNESDHSFETASPGCDLTRGPAYYAESITTKVGFYTIPCDFWLVYIFDSCVGPDNGIQVLFGEHIPYGTPGHYFFSTNPQPPYAKGWNIVEPKNYTLN